jgi:hypothetical protein
MGREKRNEGATDHYTKLVRNTMQTDAWRALSASAQALYPWVKLEWRGPQANNNGKIRLSVRQASKCMGCNPDTAARAFRDLQEKGFLHVTEAARLGLTGDAKGSTYELTELPLPNSDNHSGRRLYLKWVKGSDFPVAYVAMSSGGNPKKTKPRPENRDSNVLKITTLRKGTY